VDFGVEGEKLVVEGLREHFTDALWHRWL